KNTVSLVNSAKQLADCENYDQIWCVFDKDDFPSQDFNNAILIAEANQFGVAYSNQAFEYWLILHLDDHQGGGMNRSDYEDKINDLLKPFDLQFDGKSKIITSDLFDVLTGKDNKTSKERLKLAIERAKRNYNKSNNGNPANEESSTTVFRLVEELLKYK
ncbi:MAG: RloB family protein, partial [Flavobacteriaceae bacterium]|nr:RloB family protein [Flavobacteriaceae bacterium]